MSQPSHESHPENKFLASNVTSVLRPSRHPRAKILIDGFWDFSWVTVSVWVFVLIFVPAPTGA